MKVFFTEVGYDKALPALIKAFKKSLEKAMDDYGDNRLVPFDDEIKAAAEKVLLQEDRDMAVRKQALEEAHTIEWNCYHCHCFTYPRVEECPVFFDKYYELGGLRYMDETDMSLEDAMRYDMRDMFVDWFKEKRKLTTFDVDRNMTKSEQKRFEKEFANELAMNRAALHKDEDSFKTGINAFMKREGLSQRRLAQKIGTVNATVFNWCVGYTEPNLKTVSELIKAGMSAEEIFGPEIAAMLKTN